MRVLVCGDRNWSDEFVIGVVLDGCLGEALDSFDYPLTVIDGDARGADRIAGDWYGRSDGPQHEHVRHETYPAKWDEHGKAAGPIRNQQMLEEGEPEIVFAFHSDLAGSKGTADMVRRSKKAGIPTYVIGRA